MAMEIDNSYLILNDADYATVCKLAQSFGQTVAPPRALPISIRLGAEKENGKRSTVFSIVEGAGISSGTTWLKSCAISGAVVREARTVGEIVAKALAPAAPTAPTAK